MNYKKPRVSICIPTYNRASMVGLAIDSALNQTFKDIEVVVVDNASTDENHILRRFASGFLMSILM